MASLKAFSVSLLVVGLICSTFAREIGLNSIQEGKQCLRPISLGNVVCSAGCVVRGAVFGFCDDYGDCACVCQMFGGFVRCGLFDTEEDAGNSESADNSDIADNADSADNADYEHLSIENANEQEQ